MKKYKVTTSYLVGAGDMSHQDKWLFDTREEAQKFVDKFYEVFPKDTPRSSFTMDDPFISTWGNESEIEEVEVPGPRDPYIWLENQKREKEKRIQRYGNPTWKRRYE